MFSILGNSLCNSKICCFQIHFVTSYRKNQMAAFMLQTISSSYAKISEKSLFISATTFEKYIVCKDNCIAHHDDKTCFLPACKYPFILLGNVEELLKNLHTFCFTYQHVDCLYTLFKYRFSGKVIAKSGLVLITWNEQLTLITETREWTECWALKKRDYWGKSSKSIYSAPFRRQKQRRPLAQSLQKIEEVKKTKFELDLIKIANFF